MSIYAPKATPPEDTGLENMMFIREDKILRQNFVGLLRKFMRTYDFHALSIGGVGKQIWKLKYR